MHKAKNRNKTLVHANPGYQRHRRNMFAEKVSSDRKRREKALLEPGSAIGTVVLAVGQVRVGGSIYRDCVYASTAEVCSPLPKTRNWMKMVTSSTMVPREPISQGRLVRK